MCGHNDEFAGKMFALTKIQITLGKKALRKFFRRDNSKNI